MPDFTIIGGITNHKVIAKGTGVHKRVELRAMYGGRFWRKCKGEATIELPDGRLRRAELHWYEAHGVGKVRIKRKRYLD